MNLEWGRLRPAQNPDLRIRPASAQNNGPSKCAGLSTARSLAGLGSRLAPTISDETRGLIAGDVRGTHEPSTPAGDDARAGPSRRPSAGLQSLLCFDPAGGLLSPRPQKH